MTKHLKFLVLALSVMAFSCSDDDKAPETPSEMTINGAKATITEAFIFSHTNSTNTYHSIYFATEGINLTSYENYDDIDGTGNLLVLYITTAADGALSGTFNIADNDTLVEYYAMADGDWDFEHDGDINEVKVTKSGDTYTIEFSEEGANDYTVFYKGSLTSFRAAL